MGLICYQINAVDKDKDCIIEAWIVRINVEPPDVSRSFELSIQRDKPSCLQKRILYKNPTPFKKEVNVTTDRPDLIEVKVN